MNPKSLRERAAREALRQIRRDRERASERIRQMLTYLEEHLFDPGLNVRTLRRACGALDNSIAVRFHQEVGVTPKSYITARRMETATWLLGETDVKIWKIGALLGYSSLGVFSKSFVRWAGERPSSFRRRHRRPEVRVGESARPASPEMCQQALNGQLEWPDAERLIRRLHELYPDAGAAVLATSPGSPVEAR